MANASVQTVDDDSILTVDDKALNELSEQQQHTQATSADTTDDKSYANEYEKMECPVCLQLCVHPSKLPCGHIFCFLCVKGLKNRRCAMCRAEFPNEFLERPQLLLPINTSPSTSTTDQNEYQWFYKGHNGWWQYDERTCQEIEEAYKNAQKQCTILVAGNLYIVDFDQMLQKRQTDPARKRQVKRDLANVPKKGVAGLRLWNTDDGTQTGDGNENDSSNSNLVATIAATEAAIRIASDIIDSTLAHADDHGDQQNDNDGHNTSSSSDSSGGRDAMNITGSSDSSNDYMVVQLSSSSDSNSSGSNFSSSYNRRDMLDEIEETFNITNFSSINNSFRPTSHGGSGSGDGGGSGSGGDGGSDGFFSITLDDFRNLTLNNIADDSSSDENNEDEDDDDDDSDDAAAVVNFTGDNNTESANAARH